MNLDLRSFTSSRLAIENEQEQQRLEDSWPFLYIHNKAAQKMIL